MGTAATLTSPAGIVLSQDQQTLYWVEYGGSYSVRQVNLTTLQTSTFVGNGVVGYVEGIGTTASFVYPYALDIDYTRNIMYVADASNYRIRAVNMATRQTSTFVGSGANGHADGTGAACTLYPYSITVQQATGVLFVADPTNYNIRVITPGGVCTTLAGIGPLTTSTTGVIEGLGTSARFNAPRAATLDNFGNIIVADQGNNKLRMVTQCGQVTSITGLPNVAYTAVTVGNGGPLTAATFNTPYGLTVDARNNLVYVFEQGSSIVRAVTLPSATLNPTCDGFWHQIVQTYSGGANPQMMRTYMDGNLLSATAVSLDTSGTSATPLYMGYSGEAGNARYFSGSLSDVRVFSRQLTCAEAQKLALPPLPTVDNSVATPSVITPGVTSAVYQCNFGFAGLKSIYSKNADFSWSYSPAPPSCTACPAGTFANGLACTNLVASCGAQPSYSLGGTATGCCVAPATVPATAGCSPSGTPGAANGPVDTAFAFSGTAAEGLGGLQATPGVGFQSDRYNSPISALLFVPGGSLAATGVTLPAALPAPGAAATVSANVLCSLPASGNTTMTAVEWAQPAASDAGVRFALTVSSISNPASLTGTASTVVSGLSSPRQGVFDRSGNFYILDAKNNQIGVATKSLGYAYKVLVGSGTATKIEGVGTSAALQSISGITISQDQQTLYWSEFTVSSVRQVVLGTLQTSTLAGSGISGYLEGVGTNAQFVYPYCMDIDYSRNIMYVADGTGYRVRTIDLATRQTGTLAGLGVNAVADGPLGTCTVGAPYGVVVQQSTGMVFVTDSSNNRIRAITPDGFCSTLAGSAVASALEGIGAAAAFSSPKGITIDAFGNLLLVDANNKVRRVTLTGVVSSFTGLPNLASAAASSGDGGPLSLVSFNAPLGCSLDPTTGNLWVLDTSANSVRMLSVNYSVAIPVCDGKWHGVSAVFSGGPNPQNVCAYVDGLLVANASFSVATSGATSTPLTIGVSGEGAAANAASQFVGAISDVRVFKRAVSAAEAQALGLPNVPTFSGATFAPPVRPGVTQYRYQCLPGLAGPSNQTLTQQAADLSWVLTGPTVCTACPAQTYAAVVPNGTACKACSTVNANAVAPSPGSQYCTCRDNFFMTGTPPLFGCSACPDGSASTGGPASCTCNANFVAVNSGASLQCLCPSGYSTAGMGAAKQCFLPCTAGSYSLVSGGACVACPANGVSGADARTCTCGANSTSNGLSGAALVCRACPSNAVSLGGSSACSCLGFWDSYDPVNNVCITPPSATASVTPSQTPTPTSTVSITASGTPTTTPSLTRTGSQTASITPSITASQTATSSPTPSVTPVADVVLSFSFSITPVTGASLQPRDLAGSASVISTISLSYAQLLGIPQSQVTVANFTDRGCTAPTAGPASAPPRPADAP